jgi:molybdopterin biosynthesis enzyme MoaB
VSLKDSSGKEIERKSSNKVFSVFEVKIAAEKNQYLEIGVSNWCDEKNYEYRLTFYM